MTSRRPPPPMYRPKPTRKPAKCITVHSVGPAVICPPGFGAALLRALNDDEDMRAARTKIDNWMRVTNRPLDFKAVPPGIPVDHSLAALALRRGLHRRRKWHHYGHYMLYLSILWHTGRKPGR